MNLNWLETTSLVLAVLVAAYLTYALLRGERM